MAEPWMPVAVDGEGGRVTMFADGGHVGICASHGDYVYLDAAQREEFAQAWIAACHEADRRLGAMNAGEIPGREVGSGGS